jgi:hypothetical protein
MNPLALIYLLSRRTTFFFVFLAFIQLHAVHAQESSYVSPAGTKFLLYTPPGYAASTASFPLLVSLHSKGEVGDDLNILLTTSNQLPARLIQLKKWSQSLPFIVVTPQLKFAAPDSIGQWPANYIDEVVTYVTEHYRIDNNRIYVTGMSLGGTGCWTYASAFPEKVAALLPISGRSDIEQACAIKDIPVWTFHGEVDATVVTQYSIDIINAMKTCQPSGHYKPRLNIEYTRSHNGWTELYNGSADYRIYDWLLKFVKNDNTNKTPYVNAGPDQKVEMAAEGSDILGDFYDWDGSVVSAAWTQTSGVPLTMNDSGDGFLKLSDLQPGVFEFELTVTDDQGSVSSDRVLLEVVSAGTTPGVTGLILMNGKTNTDIGPLSEDMVIDKTQLGITEFNIRALAGANTLSIRFAVNTDRYTRSVNAPGPFLIKTQSTGPEWQMKNGAYLICATPFSKTSGGGTKGPSKCYRITVQDETTGTGRGTITRELWTNVPGTSVADIPLGSNPVLVSDLAIFEGPVNAADNYGDRIRGYVTAPVTGAYTFWIASNDNSELWLSSDETPVNKTRIAYVIGTTNKRQWTKYKSQKSVLINLVADQRYYIEALHKEGTGSDHIAVGWQLPGGVLEQPIPGKRLSPYGGEGVGGGSFYPDNEISKSVKLFPNPYHNGELRLAVSGTSEFGHDAEVKIQIHSVTGALVHEQKTTLSDEYAIIDKTETLSAGFYIVHVRISSRVFITRLSVR